MIEILPTVWVSKKAKIGENVLFGKNIIIWGNATIGSNIIIESNVEIGHPTFKEFSLKHNGLNKYQNLLDINKFITSSTNIGSNSIIRSGTIIYSNVKIGQEFDAGHNVIIREYTTIGNNCYCAVGTQIKTSVIIKNNTRLAGTISDRVTIGNYVSSLGHLMHSYKKPIGGLVEYGPVLEDYVTVGREASIIGNIKVGFGSYISAGSIVRTNIQPFSLVIDQKSKIIKNRSPIKFMRKEIDHD